MNTQEPAPGAQPGQIEPSATPASEQPPSVDVNDFSVDELMAVLDGDPDEIQAAAEAPPAAADPTPASEQPPVEEPPAQTPEEEPTPARKPEAIRLRFTALSAEQQQETAEAYRMVREGEAADMLEAYQRIRGVQAQPPASQPPAQADTQPPAHQEPQAPEPSEIEKLQARRNELREQRRQAKAEFDVEAEERLSSEIEDTTLLIAKAEAKAEAEAAFAQRSQKDAAARWKADYNAAVDELETRFPDVLDDNSEFTRLLAEKRDAAQYRNDPLLKDPRHILKLADDVAKILKPAPSGRPPVPPPSAPRANGQTVAPTSSAPARMSDEQARAVFFDESTSAEAILDALELASRR